MRRALDITYAGALWLSALCLLTIAGIVGLQVGGRLLDGILKTFGARPTGFVILSLSEFAGYLLATASFLAIAGTLKAGAHIRVTMLVNNVPESLRTIIEAAALAFAAIAIGYATWHLAQFAISSWRFNELSPGLIPFPLVYPQAAMAIGALIACVAFVDEFVITVRRGRPSFRAHEDALAVGKEA